MITAVKLTTALTGAADVVLHGPDTSNRYLSRIQGVVGPPAPRDVVRVRSQADGIVDDSKFLSERIIVLEGEIWGATGGAALSDLSTVSQAFSSTLLSPAKLTVTYENGTQRFCYVKLSGSVDVSVEGASRLAQYQVQLRAADPRWYDPTLKTVTLSAPSSGLTFSSTTSTGTTNSGTAPSPLTITVTAGSGGSLTVNEIGVTLPSTYGPLVPQSYTSAIFSNPSMSIVGSGSGFTIPASTSRTFYSATRTASSLTDIDSNTEWPMIYPGTVSMGIGAAASSVNGASCVFTWYDAYM